jgi:hypothetical protein
MHVRRTPGIASGGNHAFGHFGLVWAILLCSLCSAGAADGDERVVAIVDVYGLTKISRQAILEAACLRPGDALPDAAEKEELVRKLEAVPGVKRAAVDIVYGPLLTGGAPGYVVYVGIDEGIRPSPTFRALPTSDVALPAEVVGAFREFERALAEAIRRGNFSDDFSRGYSLSGDEEVRNIQERFVTLADQHRAALVKTLQTAMDANERAIAAWVLGYSSDRQAAVDQLMLAAHDADPEVRNDALRALSALVHYVRRHRELAIDVPWDGVVDLLDSLEWTDRNKAIAVLLELTADCDEAILAKLGAQATPSLAEMARWQSAHALMPFILLGRIAGVSDEQSLEAWKRGEREQIIARAIKPAPRP